MREIIFRGKDIVNGEWHYGYYVRRFDDCIIYSGVLPNDYVIVKPETVGQYTGLTDKNGKEVFEGDIARVFDGEYINGVVGYSLEYGAFVIDNTSLLYCLPDVKIIGNVYDNPELLEEK